MPCSRSRARGTASAPCAPASSSARSGTRGSGTWPSATGASVRTSSTDRRARGRSCSRSRSWCPRWATRTSSVAGPACAPRRSAPTARSSTISGSASRRAPSTSSTPRRPRPRPPSPSAATSPRSPPTSSACRRADSAHGAGVATRRGAGGRLELGGLFLRIARPSLRLGRALLGGGGAGLGLHRPLFRVARDVLGAEHAVREVLDEGDGEGGIAPDHVVEPVRRDDDQGHCVGGDGRGRAGSVAEQPELAQELALADRIDEALLAGDQLLDLDLADVDHEGLALGVVALSKNDVARVERARRDFTNLTAHA